MCITQWFRPLPRLRAVTTSGDYDFASGGWTQFNNSGALEFTSPSGENMRIDMSGVTAQYIGVEILSVYNPADLRPGIDVAAVTIAPVVAVPEPSSTALLGLGGLALILRRRR